MPTAQLHHTLSSSTSFCCTFLNISVFNTLHNHFLHDYSTQLLDSPPITPLTVKDHLGPSKDSAKEDQSKESHSLPVLSFLVAQGLFSPSQ